MLRTLHRYSGPALAQSLACRVLLALLGRSRGPRRHSRASPTGHSRLRALDAGRRNRHPDALGLRHRRAPSRPADRGGEPAGCQRHARRRRAEGGEAGWLYPVADAQRRVPHAGDAGEAAMGPGARLHLDHPPGRLHGRGGGTAGRAVAEPAGADRLCPRQSRQAQLRHAGRQHHGSADAAAREAGRHRLGAGRLPRRGAQPAGAAVGRHPLLRRDQRLVRHGAGRPGAAAGGLDVGARGAFPDGADLPRARLGRAGRKHLRHRRAARHGSRRWCGPSTTPSGSRCTIRRIWRCWHASTCRCATSAPRISPRDGAC